jgi:hypothetical protein
VAFVQATLPGWSGAAAAAVSTIVAMIALAAPVGAAARVASRLTREPAGAAFARLAMDLWPLGAATWLVHFGFHLVTGWCSALPPLQRAAGDMGFDLGAPRWAANCCATTPDWLAPTMLLALGAALVVSLQLLWLRSTATTTRAHMAAFLPGAVVAVGWWAVAAWIVLQPMQMRGLLP